MVRPEDEVMKTEPTSASRPGIIALTLAFTALVTAPIALSVVEISKSR